MDKQYKSSTKMLAALSLFLTTVIWGASFAVTKTSVDVLTPNFMLTVRFGMAAAAMAVVFHKKLRKLEPEVMKCGAFLGILLCLGYQFQTHGIKYTTASKNAFITSLYVIIVPFLAWIMRGKRPTVKNIAAALLAVIGMALLTLNGDSGLNFGDILTMAGSVCNAFYLIYIDRFTEKHDPILLSFVQISVMAAANAILVLVFDGVQGYDFMALTDRGLLFGLIYLSFFCTTVAFVLQNTGQKYLSVNTSSLILSMESVLGAICSVIFLKEVLSERMIAGCGLMFLAVVISELRFKK